MQGQLLGKSPQCRCLQLEQVPPKMRLFITVTMVGHGDTAGFESFKPHLCFCKNIINSLAHHVHVGGIIYLFYFQWFLWSDQAKCLLISPLEKPHYTGNIHAVWKYTLGPRGRIISFPVRSKCGKNQNVVYLVTKRQVKLYQWFKQTLKRVS